MSEIRILQGGIFRDHRGELAHVNDFHLEGAHRYYVIKHDSTEVIRGWHGHRFEAKWFQCLRGGFRLAFVQPDDWEHPSLDLVPEVFTLTAGRSELLCLPAGYANCIRATEPDSILLVFSGKVLDEAVHDSWRWEPAMWGGNTI
ncbi:dTDP-6-deoxy-3,4-keto-hexulose isomerase [Rikenella microfusus]|uniref:dTDP-6-deoxy-3,4-keto-hexulose isomerase n=1 Tax=Rikenella microfusus TaxID=28139 RepID=UPI00248D683D|nr:dTDP-6-deoxy-3,4-keto-hexulose isomerase [Rikenella microfusus]